MLSVLSVQKISENAKVPEYDSINQYTLFSTEDVHLPANKVVPVPIGLRLSFPKNYCGFIVDGFGLNAIGGLIDSDYRGEIKAMVYNQHEVLIKKGDPVARLIIIEVGLPEITTDDYLNESEGEEENNSVTEN